jgi:thioredoxin 1
MKHIFIIIFLLISLKVNAVEKKTNFNNETFLKAQVDGKVVVINSWQKTCSTCKKQIKILDQAEKQFNDVLFLSYDQENETEIAKKLNIQYWTTIVIYKDNKEVYRSIGETNKDKILTAIKSL